MLTIENLYKVYGYRLKYKRQKIEFRKDALILISATDYKIPISYENDIRVPAINSWITVNRFNRHISIGSTQYDFELENIDTLLNFLNFIGNTFFPPGYRICKPST